MQAFLQIVLPIAGGILLLLVAVIYVLSKFYRKVGP